MKTMAGYIAAFLFGSMCLTVQAAEVGTADEAVAMVKRAVGDITASGTDKVYAAITAKDPRYADRDLYVIVYGLDGKCLAHGLNPKLVGKDLIGLLDTDGKAFVKERIDQAKAKASFWQDYKFTDPITHKVQPKSTYCERLNETAVCVGIYKQ